MICSIYVNTQNRNIWKRKSIYYLRGIFVLLSIFFSFFVVALYMREKRKTPLRENKCFGFYFPFLLCVGVCGRVCACAYFRSCLLLCVVLKPWQIGLTLWKCRSRDSGSAVSSEGIKVKLISWEGWCGGEREVAMWGEPCSFRISGNETCCFSRKVLLGCLKLLLLLLNLGGKQANPSFMLKVDSGVYLNDDGLLREGGWRRLKCC